MQNTPLLTDRSALLAHRHRADHDGGMFLQTTAADDLQDRLSMVNRTFTSPAIVTGFPHIWEGRLDNAIVVPDDEVLSLKPGAHDLVIHAMCLHWANDPVGQLIQCRHALKNDGLLLTAGFGGQTLHELRASLAQAESEISGGLSPRILPMGEIRDLGGLLQRAGFALPVTDAFPQKVSYESAFRLMRDLRLMGETSALSGRKRIFTRRDVLERAAEIYAENYSEDGRIIATFEFIFMTGWSPDASQPKPLRPGSAEHRLADALGTKEDKLPKF
ncbi:MAG: SAM-dependent methyltransferase [Cognatishimia sp.]|uniref:SAM-dependent methyltransferase n=1 Tax=Cognatishimia sp. TaxID=2211648 RepID=UPI003B8E1B91